MVGEVAVPGSLGRRHPRHSVSASGRVARLAGERVRYASGRVVAAMSAAYAGEGKTDAKDAYVIAETARIRTNLAVVDCNSDLVRTLGVLTGHRADLVADRVRMINRLRDLLTSVFPALEREFDFASCKGALVLLTGYATPEAIRRMGEARLSRWLRQRRVRGYADVAARAVAAARGQQIALAGQDVAASIVAELAGTILTLHPRLAELRPADPGRLRPASTGAGDRVDARVRARPRRFAAGRTGDLAAFPTAGHLAAAAGLVPIPNDSGRRREPPQATPLQPTATTCALPIRPDLHDAPWPQPRLLPEEARPRPHPQPGRHRPGPTPHRRSLGPLARQPHLDRHPTDDGSAA